MRDTIPQPRVRPLVGNVPEIDTDAPIQSLIRLWREHGPIYRLSFPTADFVVISSHELVGDACDESRFEKHLSGPLQALRDLAGDGLFTIETGDPTWGKAHRILTPAFGPLAMRNYFEDMHDIADQMLTRWERFGPEEPILVPEAMTRLALDTIAKSAFGYRLNSFYRTEPHPFVGAMVRALTEAGMRPRRLPLLTRLKLLTRQRYHADVREMHRLADDLIAKRRAAPPETSPRDLLGLMLQARDPLSGDGLSDENIRYQLVTFLIAGHETTSGLLSFATHLLLSHPAALARAYDEVDRVLGREAPRFEQLPALVYLDCVLRETLRLWPPAPAFTVHATQDTRLANRYPLSRGDELFVLLPALHRDPAVWRTPGAFAPERFAPGAREHLPPHAWLPFGSGARACIGRAFALQEATLVLAMMLQRFTLERPAPYRLALHETLTLKPEGLTLIARPRGGPLRPAARPAVPAATPAADPPPSARPARAQLALWYGSNAGAAESVARSLADEATRRGYAASTAPLDEARNALGPGTISVIVCASYNGHPPDNARAFVSWVEEDARTLDGAQYALLGCGNRDWASTYQAIPRRIDARLQALGARPLLPRGEADARTDFFGDVDRWRASLWQALAAVFPSRGDEDRAATPGAIEVLPAPSAERAQRSGLARAELLENRELVDLSSPFGRSKRHITLRLPPGMDYQPGDYLAVLPENHPAQVARAARLLGVRPEETLVLHGAHAALPSGRALSGQELLGRCLALSEPASPGDIAFLAEHHPCPPHREALRALAEPPRYQEEVAAPRASLLDLLERFPGGQAPLAALVGRLPVMRTRQYSISSSPRAAPGQASLTVSVVRGPSRAGAGEFFGTASTFLARLVPGDSLYVAVRAPNVPFRLPEDDRTPLVMIAAGVGLAPFRGFLQERAARQAAGSVCGPAALWFGCDHPEVDFLYKEELRAYEAAGLVTVRPAFFRAPEGEACFVQHRLWREREEVWKLVEQGAHLYLCGDSLHMAPAARETLAAIYAEATHQPLAEGVAWLAARETAGTFVCDVFA